ncbi:sulfur carrier protein ThiS [Mycobacterium sp.]|uniref:sulfur carrier protein ThiS n=1 Tax=Mycobacterium sp. TaxID=1785 RepID=UPI003A8ADEC7
MIVVVNDRPVEVEGHISVGALLASMGFPDRGVAVAVDSAVLPRSEWVRRISELPSPVRLEVVTAVQGG